MCLPLLAEWAGIGAEPDNDHYKDFTGKVLSAVYLEKTPEDIGVTASITKVKAQWHTLSHTPTQVHCWNLFALQAKWASHHCLVRMWA